MPLISGGVVYKLTKKMGFDAFYIDQAFRLQKKNVAF